MKHAVSQIDLMKRDHFRRSRDISKRVGIDWLLSLDTDELLHIRCSQRVARKGTARWFFSQQSKTAPAVNIRNWEAVYKPAHAASEDERVSFAETTSLSEQAAVERGIGN